MSKGFFRKIFLDLNLNKMTKSADSFALVLYSASLLCSRSSMCGEMCLRAWKTPLAGCKLQGFVQVTHRHTHTVAFPVDFITPKQVRSFLTGL